MPSICKVIKKISQSKTARGSVLSFIMKLTGTTLLMITGILLARVLGPKDLGYYAFATSIVAILVIPATVGLPNLLIRHTSGYQVNQEWSAIAGLLRRSRNFVFYSSVVLISLFLPIGYFFLTWIKSFDFYTFALALLTLPLLSYNAIRNGAMRGFGSIVYSQLTDNVLKYVLFIIVFMIWLILGMNVSSQLAMFVNVCSIFISFLIGIYLLQKFTPRQVQLAVPEYRTKEWMLTLLPLVMSQGIQVLNKNMTTLMIGTMHGPEATGIFQVAVKGADLASFALVAINLVIAPEISKLYVQNKRNQLQRLVALSNIATTVYAFVCALFLIFFGDVFIKWVFGTAYSSAYLAIIILVIAQLYSSMVGSVGYLLIMTGNQKKILQGSFVVMIVLFILNLVLIPMLGVEGAAIASAVATVTWNSLMWIFVTKQIGINPSIFAKFKRNSKQQAENEV